MPPPPPQVTLYTKIPKHMKICFSHIEVLIKDVNLYRAIYPCSKTWDSFVQVKSWSIYNGVFRP